ncbi:MAG: hypothetical protein IJ890_05560 [Clostridia bacterium]|nr:hypothetical protein [Clostridia bacterium]
MSVQEIQLKYAKGEITYEQYCSYMEDLRKSVSNITQTNNSIYYLFGVGLITIIILYLGKKIK